MFVSSSMPVPCRALRRRQPCARRWPQRPCATRSTCCSSAEVVVRSKTSAAFNDEAVVRKCSFDADAGGERGRPRNRRDAHRFRCRSARRHAHGGGRVGSAGDKCAASDVLDDLAQALKRRLLDAVDRAAQRVDQGCLEVGGAPGDAVRRRATIARHTEPTCLAGAAHQHHMDGLASTDWLPVLRAPGLSPWQPHGSRRASRLDAAAVRLDAVDPRRVLSRGYALLDQRRRGSPMHVDIRGFAGRSAGCYPSAMVSLGLTVSSSTSLQGRSAECRSFDETAA